MTYSNLIDPYRELNRVVSARIRLGRRGHICGNMSCLNQGIGNSGTARIRHLPADSTSTLLRPELPRTDERDEYQDSYRTHDK